MEQMKKMILTTLLILSAASYARAEETDEYVNPNTETSVLAEERGLISADQLDSSVMNDETAIDDLALDQRRDPPGRGGRPRQPKERGPKEREWVCEARNDDGRVFRGRDRDQQQARREATRECEQKSRRSQCRLIGCSQ